MAGGARMLMHAVDTYLALRRAAGQSDVAEFADTETGLNCPRVRLVTGGFSCGARLSSLATLSNGQA